MTVVHDKKRAQSVARNTARQHRARVEKRRDERQGQDKAMKLPPWRELVGVGPAEQQSLAAEAEQASPPTAEAEQIPTELKEDQPAPEQATPTAAAESARAPSVEIDAPMEEAPVIAPPEAIPEVEADTGSAEEIQPQVADATSAAVEDAPILRRSRDPSPPAIDSLKQARMLAERSRGEPLSAELRQQLPGIPASLLDQVCVHTDKAAALAAEHLQAEAFTIAHHIYFAGGRLNRQSQDSLALLTHELAHVAQYREGRLNGLPPVSQPQDSVEQEADTWASHWRIPPQQAPPQQQVSPGDSSAGFRDELSLQQSQQPLPPSNLGGSGVLSAPPDEAPVLRRATDTAKAFFDKSYFAQADEWSTLSGNIDGSLQSETQATTAAFPTPTAELGPASQPQVAAPAAPQLPSLSEQLPEVGTDTTEVQAESVETPSTPDTPSAPRLEFGTDGDSSAAQRNFSAALDQVPTSLDGLSTSPGPSPPVELNGPADPGQAAEQARSADEQAEQLRQQASANVDNGPGPEQVQPRSIREAHAVEAPAAPTSEPLAEVGRMAEIQAAGTVTEDIQAQTDALGQEQMDVTLAEAKTQLDTAASEADESRAEEVQAANEENQRLNTQANAEQDAAVSEARTQIDNDREETKRQQQTQVDEAQVRSEEERQRLEDDVEARVQEDERRIDDEFSDAEHDAEQEKENAESQAESRKQEVERDAESDSWWDRLADAITSAFTALTSFINTIFDAAISAVGAIIDAAKQAAADIINAARDFVMGALQVLGNVLTGLVNDLLGDIFPGLAAALNELIDAAVDLAVSAVNALADGLIAGINALLDSIGGAITAILEAYRAAINAALAMAQALLTGDWAALGRMVLEAVLTLAGIPPEAFYALIAQAMGALDTIIDDPGAFVGNVINAVAQGFQRFADNILTHLQEGFFRWIVGPLGELGITLPTTWDILGILSIVLQVLGLTASGIRGIIVEVLGEAAGAIFDFVWRYVEALVTGGWAGLWEQIQNDLSQLWSTVVDGIKDYLIETIITQAVLRIATMFNPVGALLNAIVMVWNVYNFLRTNIQRIWGVVTAVVDMFATIVSGNIAPAAQAVENAIASLIPIAISLLANLLGLGGLTTRVREVLESLRAAVRNAIISLIRRVQGLFRGGGSGTDSGTAQDGGAEAGDDRVIGEDQPVSGGGESHTVHIDTRGRDTVLEIRTAPTPAQQWINNLVAREPWSSFARDDDFIDKRDEALRLASQINTEADQIAAMVSSHAGDENPPAVEDDSVEAKEARFAATVNELLRFGSPSEEGIPAAYEARLAEVHPQARTDVRTATAALFQGPINLGTDTPWNQALPQIQAGIAWWSTPLNNGPAFAAWAIPNQAVPAALAAARRIGRTSSLPESFGGSASQAGAVRYVDRSKGGIHGRSTALNALQREVFDVGSQGTVQSILRDQYQEMLEGTGGDTTSVDEKINDYRTILQKLKISFTAPQVSNPATDNEADTFRRQMRDAIILTYRSNVEALHTEVISSNVIPTKYNRIRGDIFEGWLASNVPGILNRTPYLLKADSVGEVEAMADGMIEAGTTATGSTLIEAKAYSTPQAPTGKALEQMRRYERYLPGTWLLSSLGSRTFRNVQYHFTSIPVAEAWESKITQILASKGLIYVGSATLSAARAVDGAESDSASDTPSG